MKYKKWSKEEIDLLIYRYPSCSKVELEEMFDRPYYSIRRKASDLRIKNEKWWTEEEELLFRGIYPFISNLEIATIINRTEASIIHKAKRLGLIKNIDMLTSRRSSDNRKYNFNTRYFREINNSDKAYILGFLLGDGNISNKKYRMRLQINMRDEELLYFIKIKMNANNPILYKKENDICDFSLSSFELIRDLSCYNMKPRKTYNLVIPDNIPNNLYSHLIRGLFDADGCIYVGKNKLMVSICGTGDVCEWIKKVGKKFVNIKGNVYYYDGRVPIYKLGGRKQISRFAEWLYKDATFFLSRKYNKFVEAGVL